MVIRRPSLFLLLVGAILIAPFVLLSSVNAQRGNFVIKATEIRVEGSNRIEPDTVRSYVPVKIGDPITAQVMDEALKKLFATGLFADVIVRQDGTAVVVRVTENPIINRIAFEGNKRIEDNVLRDEVKLRPRIVYTRSRVQNDVQRLLDVYRRNGRFAATVEPKVIQLPQSRVDLVFEIKEGPVTEIRRISFVGNARFGDGRLREVVRTKETAWYRFLTADDNYDPDRLTFDRELLRRFYLSQGYADFRVVSAIAELAPDREGFFITFTVEEGERYKFGKLDVVAALRDVSSEQLRQDVTVKEGDWYNADVVEDVVNTLTDVVGTFGFAFVDIRPQVKRDRTERKIDVTFRIQEGPRVYVERVNITGNVRTIDPVIRRQVPLIEGDAFNASKLRRARQRIRNLGFFENVEVTNVRGSSPDKTVINVKVSEKPTGEVSFGAGFSSSAGPLGDVGIRERNLLGRGQDLSLKLRLAANSSEIDLKFTEPYFMDRPLRAGFDVFHTKRDLQDESSFDRTLTGAGLRAGYKISEKMSQSWRYTLSRDEISDVKDDASLAIKEQEGTKTKSEISQTFAYDGRDNRLDAKSGFTANYVASVAGLGGDVQFFRNRLKAAQLFSITDKVFANVGGDIGYIVGIDQDTRIVDRFFLGGDNLRGFKNFGAGPRDLASDDAMGGNWMYSGTVEVGFPLGLPNEFGISGRVFTDVGSAGGVDSNLDTIVDDQTIRASVGVGLTWKSAFGPIAVDIAQAVLKEEYDKTEIIRFNFGAKF